MMPRSKRDSMAAERDTARPEQAKLTEGRTLSTGRRRLLRGALGAAPVVLAATSRPVMGATCMPASSFVSMNASRPDQGIMCGGRSPGYWGRPQWFSEWPAPYVPGPASNPKATRFDDVFGSMQGYPGMTLLEVVNQDGGGRNALARHIVASLLNAAKGLTPPTVLSVPIVKGIWADFVMNGYYEPTAGIKWYVDYAQPPEAGDGIVPWLKSTMT